MSRRETPWTSKDTWQCIGMIPLTAGALLACSGNLSLEDMGRYLDTAGDLAVPISAGVGGAVLAVAMALFAVRYLRVALLAALRIYWQYRRRWSRVLTDLGLTETQGEHVMVPRLVSVTRYGDDDVMTIRMLPGQSAVDYHERSAALAEEFGANSAKVSFGLHRHREVVVAFNRTPTPRKPLLELEAQKPHPIPLALPEPQQQGQGRYRPQAHPGFAISLTGLQLRIVWARVQRFHENDHTGVRTAAGRARYGLRGEMRWATWATA